MESDFFLNPSQIANMFFPYVFYAILLSEACYDVTPLML